MSRVTLSRVRARVYVRYSIASSDLLSQTSYITSRQVKPYEELILRVLECNELSREDPSLEL